MKIDLEKKIPVKNKQSKKKKNQDRITVPWSERMVAPVFLLLTLLVSYLIKVVAE